MEQPITQNVMMSLAPMALAHMYQKVLSMLPVVGGRRIEHLQRYIEALSATLSCERMNCLERQSDFEIGFQGYFGG